MEYSLSKLQFIESKTRKKLSAFGIKNTRDLLSFALSLEKREKLSREINVPELTIYKWANKCILMQIKGVGLKNSEILFHIGIDTIEKLKKSDPHDVYERMVQFTEKSDYKTPNVDQVSDWISQAKPIHIEKEDYTYNYIRRGCAMFFSTLSAIFAFWGSYHIYSILFSFLSIFLIIYELNLPFLITMKKNRRERLTISILGSFFFLFSIIMRVILIGLSEFRFSLSILDIFILLVFFLFGILFVFYLAYIFQDVQKFEGIDYRRGIKTLLAFMVFMGFGGDALVSPIILLISFILFFSRESITLFSLSRIIKDFWYNVCDSRNFPLAEHYSEIMTLSIFIFATNLAFFREFSMKSLCVLLLSLFSFLLSYFWIYRKRNKLQNLIECAMPMSVSVAMGVISPASWPWIKVLKVDLMYVVYNHVTKNLIPSDMYARTWEMIEQAGFPGTIHLLEFCIIALLIILSYEIVKSITAAWQELRLEKYVREKKPLEITEAFKSYFSIQGIISIATALLCTVMALFPAPDTWFYLDMGAYEVRIYKLIVLVVLVIVLCVEFIEEINTRESIYMPSSSIFKKGMRKLPASVDQSIQFSAALFIAATIVLLLTVSDFFIITCISLIWLCIHIIIRSDLIMKGEYESNISIKDLSSSFMVLEAIKKDKLILASLVYGLIGLIFLILSIIW